MLHIVSSDTRYVALQHTECIVLLPWQCLQYLLHCCTSIQMGNTFAFPRRTWLRESITNFRYTYIVFLVIKREGRPIVIYFRDGNGRSSNGFCRECQSIQSSQLLTTKILSKAA
jgi:hypothetical protein